MSTYQIRLLERRARFLERWQTRLSGTAEAIGLLDTNRARHDALLQINKDFHQLSGAAGIYELHTVCSAAMAAEDICIPLLRSGKSASNEDIYSLKIFLSSIVETFAALKTSSGECS